MYERRKEAILARLKKEAGVIGWGLGKLTGAGASRAWSKAKDIALGKPIKGGPMAGKRMVKKKGLQGMSEVSKAEFKRLKRKGHDVGMATDEAGKKIFMRRDYGRGGLVGAAARHPLATAGVAAYAVSPTARAAINSMNPFNSVKQRANEARSPYGGQQWG
jgi:hypothetical protein